jgi:hypothetical protein
MFVQGKFQYLLFPSNKEVQSKSAIVFSEMEEHDIEENAQDKVKLLQKNEEGKLHPVKNAKNEESTENRKKDWVHVGACLEGMVVGLAAALAYRRCS